MSKRQRRFERIIANTKRIEALDLPLHYFSNIHVRIDNRVDFWASTGNWHLKGKKKEGKSFAQMVNYLKGEDVSKNKDCKPYCNELVLIDCVLTGGVVGIYKCRCCGKRFN